MMPQRSRMFHTFSAESGEGGVVLVFSFSLLVGAGTVGVLMLLRSPIAAVVGRPFLSFPPVSLWGDFRNACASCSPAGGIEGFTCCAFVVWSHRTVLLSF